MKETYLTIGELEKLVDSGGTEAMWQEYADGWLTEGIELDEAALLKAMISDGVDGLISEVKTSLKTMGRRAFLAGVVDAMKMQSINAGPNGFSSSYSINDQNVSVWCHVDVWVHKEGEPDDLIQSPTDFDTSALKKSTAVVRDWT